MSFRSDLKLVVPLVRPMSATFCLMSFLGSWNSFFGPSVFLQTQEKLTLPVILNLYIGVYTNEYGVFLAGTLLAIIPPAISVLRSRERIHQWAHIRRSQRLAK
ncbi:MAG: hypothetical protein QM756_10675 [Polyangiaceae bacterium]